MHDQALVDGDLVVLGLGRAGEQHVVDHRVVGLLDVGLALLLDALDSWAWRIVGVPAKRLKHLLEVGDLLAGLVLVVGGIAARAPSCWLPPRCRPASRAQCAPS
jgi:hypothetical protein